MRILIAPNAFKGTLSAGEAGAAAAGAVKEVLPSARAEVLPIADGGDGLLEALRPVLGGRLVTSRVEGPLGRKLAARWLLAGRAAVIEMSEAAGLRRMGGRALRPMEATTAGVGGLMLEAVRRGAKELVIGLGGSASNDGGAGCAQAFGFSLLDAAGRPVPPGAAGAGLLKRILPGSAAARLRGVKVTGLADVRNPLCGRLGSARVFGPQKGAGPREVAAMEKALRDYAAAVRRELGVSISSLPGGAAAGGLGAGLAAFFGASLEDGSSFVLSRLGFERKLAAADLLITGEGRFDEQTFYGKAPGAALAAAKRLGKPAVVVCGRSLLRGGALRRRGVSLLVEAGAARDEAGAVRRALVKALPGFLRGLTGC
ncbi:MAG: glycerate kinase [Elusimicrobia bacterium]|nr:glycerate kinase [Elusimicrobiota bacterium]